LEDFFENEAVERFEEMLENNEEVFFDEEEYDDIISYYLEIGDYQHGEIALSYAQNLYSDSVDIKIRKLELFIEKGDNLAAKTLIQELEDIANENLDYILCTAKYHSNMGNSQKAIALCKKALNKGEDEDFIHNFIADEYSILGDPFSALKHYKLALYHNTDDEYIIESIMSCYQAMNRKKEALSFIEDYLDNFPFSESAWWEYSLFNFNNKNYVKAIESLDFLLAINPKFINAYTNKAECYEALENWEEAIKTYEELQEYEFTKSYSFYRIGLCYRNLEQPILALKTLHKSLYEDPQFHASMVSISEIYEELGNVQEAARFALEASKFNENDVELQQRLAFLYVSMGELEIAINCLEKIVEIEPKRFYNWYAYVEILMLIGDYNRAKNKLIIATKIHNRAELYYQMSNCYFNLSLENHAKTSLKQALELDPTLLHDMQLKYPLIAKG